MNPNSAFNKERLLRDSVDRWLKVRALKTMTGNVRHMRSLATAKMQACVRLFKKIEVGGVQKKGRIFRILVKNGLLEKRMLGVGKMMEFKKYSAGFEAIGIESQRVARHMRKIKRFEESAALRKLRSTFREIKRHWEQLRSMNQLGAVFNKMHGQMEVKTILTKWRRFVFNNDKSYFHKSITAKDHWKVVMRREHFGCWKSLAQSSADRRQRLESIDRRRAVRLVRLAWRSLAQNTVQSRQRKRFEVLNRVMRGWRSETEKVIQERALEKIVNEENELQSVHEEKLHIKRDRNERFIWLLMGKDAPPEIAMRLAGRGGDRDYTDKNQTEFSSEDMIGEEIAIKSAL